MQRFALRRALAAVLLSVVAAGFGVLVTAGRLASRAAEPDTSGDAADLAASLRRSALLPEDGRPALLVVLDSSCGACEQAREDLRGDALGLDAAGVHVVSIERERLLATGARLSAGFFPAYVLLDADGRILATRRGYASPPTTRRWVQAGLLATPAAAGGP